MSAGHAPAMLSGSVPEWSLDRFVFAYGEYGDAADAGEDCSAGYGHGSYGRCGSYGDGCGDACDQGVGFGASYAYGDGEGRGDDYGVGHSTGDGYGDGRSYDDEEEAT